MKYMRAPAPVRFERLYIPEPNSGCWLWLGSANDDGYGRFRFGGRVGMAHRASYEMFRAKIPDGLQVLHHCDNPGCVNPNHLFVGTITDNMHDMVAKGRNVCRRGVNHHKAKLNPEKAFSIRWQAAMGQSWSTIAKEYGVAKHMIQCIVHNRNWRQEAHD